MFIKKIDENNGLNWDTFLLASIFVITITLSTYSLTKTIDKETMSIQSQTQQIYTRMLDRETMSAQRRAQLDNRLSVLEVELVQLTTQVTDKSRTINQLQEAVTIEANRKMVVTSPIPVIIQKEKKDK